MVLPLSEQIFWHTTKAQLKDVQRLLSKVEQAQVIIKVRPAFNIHQTCIKSRKGSFPFYSSFARSVKHFNITKDYKKPFVEIFIKSSL